MISAGSGTTAPTMPSLSAWIETNGTAELPDTADWSLVVWYSRPDRSDLDVYPAGSPGYETVYGDEEWYADFGLDFRGGRTWIRCNFGDRRKVHELHIRGYNPDPDDTIAYINANNTANGFSHWYAQYIAKHESIVQSAPTPVRYYNQFNPSGTEGQLLPGPNEATNPVGQPNRGNVQPYGWGLFQLTRWDLPPYGTYDYPQPEHLWNWRSNTATAIEILGDKRTTAQNFEADVQRTYSQTIGNYVGSGYTAPGPVTINNRTFTIPLDAATIVFFNGLQGCSPEWTISSGGQWEQRNYCWSITFTTVQGDRIDRHMTDRDFVDNVNNYLFAVSAFMPEGQVP